MQLSLGHIIKALSESDIPTGENFLSRVVVDSRQVTRNALFVALEGDNVDGHEFVLDAFQRGAMAALVERTVPGDHACIDVRQTLLAYAGDNMERPVCIQVDDTLLALQQCAAYWRRLFSPRIIGITGSVGKTTTKELVYSVLQTRYRTLRSRGNLNNEIGLPLTLLQLTPSHERVVLEMGMYARGEIATLASIAGPQVGVVTNIGPVHLERLGSIQAIADAKTELVQALPSAPEGIAILNYDEPLVRAMTDKTTARVFTYGLSQQADLWASDIQSDGLEGIRFVFHYRNEAIHVRASLLGRHSVHTALRAAAVALVEGLDWSDIVNGLQGESLQLRLVAVPGPNDSLLLDDTYNASPASTIAALNLLAELDGRRVAVLGDMLELGSHEEAGHRHVGRRVPGVADLLITVGSLGQIIAEEAVVAGMPVDRVVVLPDVQAAMELLPHIIKKRDMVLLKGSRGVRLDKLVDFLTPAINDSDSGVESRERRVA